MTQALAMMHAPSSLPPGFRLLFLGFQGFSIKPRKALNAGAGATGWTCGRSC